MPPHVHSIGVVRFLEDGGVCMADPKVRRKVIMTQARGQVTLPSEFRDALGIGVDSLLSISLVGDHLEIAPLSQGNTPLRRYTDEEITKFLEDDRLDEQTAQRVKLLLDGGAI